MRKETLWEEMKRQNPGHSAWYIKRFEQMRADGADLHGEARLVDAMVPRGSRILDAGCGPGRLGGELARRGHTVVGVDVDPELIEAARKDHPDCTWLVGDLTESGGKADVYIDGKKSDLAADAYIVPNTIDRDLWRVYGLAPGEHILRLVTREDADSRSKGHTITISRAIVYQTK